MDILSKQLLITLFLTILLTIVHYFNSRKNINKDTPWNHYIKVALFNFIFINISFFCGYKLFGDNEITDQIKSEILEVEQGEPDF